MINLTPIILILFIFIFAVIYLNKDRLKTIFLGLKVSKKGKYIKICPKCASINIKIDFSNPVVWNYGTPTKYKCNSCGYLGTLFPEVLENKIQYYQSRVKKDFKAEKLEDEEEIDVSTGYFVGIWEIIFVLINIPLFLVMLIISYYFSELDNFDPSFSIIMALWFILFIYIGLRLIKQRKNKRNLKI